jgi:hypothetical protein
MLNTPTVIEAQARRKYNCAFAHVFSFVAKSLGEREQWFGISIGSDSRSPTILGLRRSIDELPALVERGRLY